MSEQREWSVTVPIVGRMVVFVQAESEEEAIAKAKAGDWEESEILESEMVEQCRGNVCHLHSGIDVEPNE